MRYLILSDIHGNLEALLSVLQDARGEYDQIVNCGDLVGYGPDPNAVVDLCREHSTALVRGNHDKVCASLEGLDWFNPVARIAAIWTHHALTDTNREYVRELAKGPQPVDDFQILHGSPADEDEYLLTEQEVESVVPYLKTSLSFFGHTHVQGGFLIHRNGVQATRLSDIELEPGSSYLINPGSVGQPRDGDPHAAYAIYTPGERLVSLRRARYPIGETQQKIVDAGLPHLLAARLAVGG